MGAAIANEFADENLGVNLAISLHAPTNEIRNKRIYQSWISGDKYFYHLHESENINKEKTKENLTQ